MEVTLAGNLTLSSVDEIIEMAEDKYGGTQVKVIKGRLSPGSLSVEPVSVVVLLVALIGLLLQLRAARRDNRRDSQWTKERLLQEANDKMAEMGCLSSEFTHIENFSALKNEKDFAVLTALDVDTGKQFRIYVFADGDSAALQLA